MRLRERLNGLHALNFDGCDGCMVLRHHQRRCDGHGHVGGVLTCTDGEDGGRDTHGECKSRLDGDVPLKCSGGLHVVIFDGCDGCMVLRHHQRRCDGHGHVGGVLTCADGEDGGRDTHGELGMVGGDEAP
jgi:hypothetical protein